MGFKEDFMQERVKFMGMLKTCIFLPTRIKHIVNIKKIYIILAHLLFISLFFVICFFRVSKEHLVYNHDFNNICTDIIKIHGDKNNKNIKEINISFDNYILKSDQVSDSYTEIKSIGFYILPKEDDVSNILNSIKNEPSKLFILKKDKALYIDSFVTFMSLNVIKEYSYKDIFSSNDFFTNLLIDEKTTDKSKFINIFHKVYNKLFKYRYFVVFVKLLLQLITMYLVALFLFFAAKSICVGSKKFLPHVFIPLFLLSLIPYFVFNLVILLFSDNILDLTNFITFLPIMVYMVYLVLIFIEPYGKRTKPKTIK